MTNAQSQISVTRDGVVATLTLDRPDSLNALTPDMLEQACEAVRKIAASDVRVLIVTGAGRAFCVGADLKLAKDPSFGEADRNRFAVAARALQKLFETMPQPVIAKVRGHCMTGGLEIAITADILIASDNARFADTHAKVGFRPRWGMSQRLPRLIGRMQAAELAFTARTIDAAEAAAIGLVLEVVPDAELDQRVASLAETMAANNPKAIAAYKALMRKSADVGLEAGLIYEAETEFPL
jgi:enoyl-CoA hydratase/carnithine racemase